MTEGYLFWMVSAISSCAFGCGWFFAYWFGDSGEQEGAFVLLVRGFNERRMKEIELKAKWLNQNESR